VATDVASRGLDIPNVTQVSGSREEGLQSRENSSLFPVVAGHQLRYAYEH
jgi:hypothetical protein